ncbi:MAG: L,D-transpeptidase family protein [Proteobacteria bacterium]|nr:L,D-transpeptidase family protein [Pseudomonadota bacterium]
MRPINLIKRGKAAIAGLSLFALTAGSALCATPDDVGLLIEAQLGEAGRQIPVLVEGEQTPLSTMRNLFYRGRAFRPAWSSGHRPTLQAEQLLDAIGEAEMDGLRAEFYKAAEIKALIAKLDLAVSSGRLADTDSLAGLDLLLTESFLRYSYDLIAGRVNPATIEGEWADNTWETDLHRTLEKAIRSGNLKELISSLPPPHPGYEELKAELATYREIAQRGGWPGIPTGRLMAEGSRGRRVALLKERLIVTGDLYPENEGTSRLFDDSLSDNVAWFQARHGLEADGIVGEMTLEALNVPVEERIRQMELNLERWRWLPYDFGERYIMVNSADFSLSVFDKREEVMTMRIIVGKPFWHTPSFSSTMTRLIFNPSWTATPAIVVEDLLPKVMEDHGYLERLGFVVYRGWGKDAEEVDPYKVDWREVKEEELDYRFTQLPGPLNPLGRLKFIFQNPFDVYMHDTTRKDYFFEPVRTFSHGCIRLEEPFMLAKYLLGDKPGWTSDKIVEAVESGEKLTVQLPGDVEVHLLYWTAWVDVEGTLQFRSDIYDRDSQLNEALLGEITHEDLP